MKKQLLLTAILILVCNNVLLPMKNTGQKPVTHVVYSHGFGEEGKMTDEFDFLGNSISAPIYPDAPGDIAKAVFYTKRAVHTLTNHLHDEVITNGRESICLAMRSCGAGIGFNALERLVNYEKHEKYFQDSRVRSKEDADRIIAAINNGAVVVTAPMLGVHKAQAVAYPSSLLAGVTCAAGAAATWYYASTFIESEDAHEVKMGIFGMAALAYSLLSDAIKHFYSSLIVRLIVPTISNGHFDPHHPIPLDSVTKLTGKITCPILLHFNKEDGVLENPDEDTIKVYDALKGEKTHIVITDDGWHNALSRHFYNILTSFKSKYFDDVAQKEFDQTTRPTVDTLRKQIYPRDLKSIFMRNKAMAVGAVLAAPMAMLIAKEILEKE